MKQLILALILLPFFGCGFKSNSSKSTANSSQSVRMGFIPKDLKFTDAGKTYALLDVVTVPNGNFEIDNTLPVQGMIEYLYQYPIFKETQCTGLGYTMTYEARRKTATTQLKLIPYVNSKLVSLDHLVVGISDTIQVAVYGEYLPISDYLDNAALPNEFIKTFQPSNKCHEMCAMAQVKPVRDVVFDPANRISCTPFWNTANGGYSPLYPGTVTFNPVFLTRTESRDFMITQLQGCGAVQSNDDLKNYYDQATTGECQSSAKINLKEWYFVEQKLPYSPPVYTISNFSSIIKSTGETQNESIKDQNIHLTSDWSN